MGHLFVGTTEFICYAVGLGLMTVLGGTWRAARARRQRWAENQSWRELMMRLESERGGSLV